MSLVFVNGVHHNRDVTNQCRFADEAVRDLGYGVEHERMTNPSRLICTHANVFLVSADDSLGGLYFVALALFAFEHRIGVVIVGESFDCGAPYEFAF